MTITDGYYSNWITVNERNLSIGSFPRAEVYYSDEKNMDTLAGASDLAYTIEVSFEIHVFVTVQQSSKNPLFDVLAEFDKALDDLKMLFGNNSSVNSTCDSFMFTEMKREAEAKDQFIPTKMITKWRAVYSQDRKAPSLYASS